MKKTKKRKGTEPLCPNKEDDVLEPRDLLSSISNWRFHVSLEDYSRLRKRCKDDGDCNVVVGCQIVKSCKSTKLAGIAATAPPCGTTSSSLLSGRGLKRKIGCIDAATQMGRKNRIDEDYVSGETIGRGKFGCVWLCRSKVSGVEFACKTLKKGEDTVHCEVEIMQHLSGFPGVVTLEAVYEDADRFHLVMELCSGGRLIDQMAEVGSYSEHRAANIFRDLMLIIKYCHEMGVVHRDIKPENILLTASGKIKLADFGLAMRIAKGHTLTGLAGSPAYVAPEVILGDYSEKADIWSAGVLLHALLVGILPFQGDSQEAVFESIKNKRLDFHSEKWASVSKLARDLLDRILTRDVEARMTADEVLSHPWILFYTERTLPFKLKSRHPGAASNLISASISTLQPDTSIIPCIPTSSASSSQTDSKDSVEQDDSSFVDALSVAISHVRISELKRIRLCDATREQCSSNMNPNNLCKAF
ncbi:hypothetical protein M9H77_32154 [Catharanthus roseus]|uniref:Uncharacterized protein n=1 Tax=Catharanthus roseus TaxID=4058 RepID=A0ACC0A3D3_CATRO|nr:hypothetical protein M9H77_32154 [Catharanthus roseus]